MSVQTDGSTTVNVDIRAKIREINNSDLSIDEKTIAIQNVLYRPSSPHITSRDSLEQDISNDPVRNRELSYTIPCTHYSRTVKLFCNICQEFFNCRICHNQIITSHLFDRHTVSQILCNGCQSIQSPSNFCFDVDCMYHEQFSNYYCQICNLYADGSDDIYHCEKCGICRKGKTEDYTHCDKCSMDILSCNYSEHECTLCQRVMNCPVCLDNIHISIDSSFKSSCGHWIHFKCIPPNDYRCPICRKSMNRMDNLWNRLNEEKLINPMPEEFNNTTVDLYCQDCEADNLKLVYHFTHNNCQHCGSYNTRIVEVYNLPQV